MTENDEWVQVALMDDVIVAELILRLRQPPLPSPKRKEKAPALVVATLCPLWTVRQQRSKQVIKKKATESPLRASPTTPLSWNEATSVSGGVAEGAEDSSRFVKLSNSVRSESLSAGVTSEGHFKKRGRKRKQTVSDLIAVESTLLNESIRLKSELAMLHSDVEKVRAINGSLKRMMVDVLSQHMIETFTAATASKQVGLNQSRQVVVAQHPIYSVLQGVPCVKLHQCLPNLSSEGSKWPSFLLPDLNLPVEESEFEENFAIQIVQK